MNKLIPIVITNKIKKMINFTHFSDHTLIAYIDYYKILLKDASGISATNLMLFKQQCEQELKRRHA